MMTSEEVSGQTTVEYIFILAIAIMLGFAITNRFTDFFQHQTGRIGHVLSTHLIIGICPQNCWYSSYYNGHKQ